MTARSEQIEALRKKLASEPLPSRMKGDMRLFRLEVSAKDRWLIADALALLHSAEIKAERL